MDKYINIVLPPQFDLIIIKNNDYIKLNLYNKNYKFNFFIKNIHSNVVINKHNNSIKITHKKLFNSHNLVGRTLNNFLKLIDIYEFVKIKFKGKGFKIGFYKNKNIMNFFFGSSHINTFLIKDTIIKKINKYKFVLKSNNFTRLNTISKKITKIRYINFYTLRGLRKSRQQIIKRKGRKGTFM
jgi:ribosomal protein L6P/L9E